MFIKLYKFLESLYITDSCNDYYDDTLKVEGSSLVS